MTSATELATWQHVADVRLTSLETARRRHAKKISAHEGLLTAMDHDVTDAQVAFRAQLAVLNALRETQSEQHDRLTELETRTISMEGRLTGVEGRLTSVEEVVHKVHVGVDTIIAMLRRVEESEQADS